MEDFDFGSASSPVAGPSGGIEAGDFALEDPGFSGLESETGEAGEGGEVGANPTGNPWPHLKDFYVYVERKEKNLNYQCVLCQPKAFYVKAHISSAQNLKCHISRSHPARYVEFLDVVSMGSAQGKKKRSRKGWLFFNKKESIHLANTFLSV
jgi:hypothetical protein